MGFRVKGFRGLGFRGGVRAFRVLDALSGFTGMGIVASVGLNDKRRSVRSEGLGVSWNLARLGQRPRW